MISDYLQDQSFLNYNISNIFNITITILYFVELKTPSVTAVLNKPGTSTLTFLSYTNLPVKSITNDITVASQAKQIHLK